MSIERVVTVPGRVFLRYGKGAIPVVILAAYSLAVPKDRILGSEQLEHAADLIALAAVLLGLTLRAIVNGSGSSDALALRERGIYALSRNPRYLGSLLICFGIFLMHGSPSVVLFGMATCFFIYAAMVRAEEENFRARFGDAYRTYRETVPRWLPALSRLRLADLDFSVRRALASDWPVIAASAAVLAFTEVHESLPPALAESSQLIVIALAATLALVTSVTMAFRGGTAERQGAVSARRDILGQPAPATRGIRVDGRVGQVDRLENWISLGQQEAILRDTLDAAALGPDERLVDVGCGTGKLVVAAARRLGGRHGGPSHVLGIDATPGMIDLAIRRAHDAGVTAEFQVGIAEALPVADGSANAVTSSYFFHHLPSDVKPLALREMWRVLAPGGRLVIMDYGRARGLRGLIMSIPMRANFYEYVRPQLRGELEAIIAAEGLGEPEVFSLYLGYITVMRLVKPA